MELYRVFDKQTRSITTDRKSYGGQVFDSNSTRIHFTLKDGGDDWDFEAEGYSPFIVFNVYDKDGNPYVYGHQSQPIFSGHDFTIPYEITSQARSLRVEYILWFVKAEVADRFDGTPEGLLVTEYLCSAVDGIAFRASCIKPQKPGCGCAPSFSPATSPTIIGPLEALRTMAVVRPIEKVTHVNQFGEEQGLDFFFKSLSGEFQQMWLNVPTLSDEGKLKLGQLPFGNGYGMIPMLASSVGKNQALVFSPESGGFIGKKLGATLKYVEREDGTDKRHLVQMLDLNGEVIGEADLPIEDLVESSYWDDENKELVLVFGTGREARIPMKDLVDIYTGVAGEIAISKVSSSSNGANATYYAIGIDSAYTASIANRFASAASATANVQNLLDAHKANLQNPHKVTKAQIGLGNADNTSDIDKPVSTAQKAYVDAVRTVADSYHTELAEYDKTQDVRMDGIRSDLTALTEREDKRHQDVTLSLGARYTKADTDRLLQGKMDLVNWGDNIKLDASTNTVNVDLSGVKVTADDTLNTTSKNPIQNQAVAKALGNKQDKLVQGDNIVLKTNSDGTVRISSSATPTVVDNALDYTSENPVQNKVIYRALDQKANIGEGVGVWKGQTQGSSYLYQRGDVVVYEDALYISKVDNNDHHPDDESCWAAVRGGAVTQVVGITPATYIGLIGNDTDTEYEIKHKLGSRNLVFSFMTNDSNHEFIQARAWAPTMDTMRVRFTSPPGTNRIVVNIIKARSVNPSASQDFPLVVGVDTPAKTWSYTNETGCPLYAKAYDETGNDIGGDIIQNSGTDFDPLTISFAKEQKGTLVLASTTSDLVYEVELDGEHPYVITGLTNDRGYLVQCFKDGEGQSRLDILQEAGKVTIDASAPWKGFVALYPASGIKKFTAADLKSVTHDGTPSYELTYQHNKGRAVGAQIYTSEGLALLDMHAEANTIKAYMNNQIEGMLYII